MRLDYKFNHNKMLDVGHLYIVTVKKQTNINSQRQEIILIKNIDNIKTVVSDISNIKHKELYRGNIKIVEHLGTLEEYKRKYPERFI